jgi:hypothetical protein
VGEYNVAISVTRTMPSTGTWALAKSNHAGSRPKNSRTPGGLVNPLEIVS